LPWFVPQIEITGVRCTHGKCSFGALIAQNRTICRYRNNSTAYFHKEIWNEKRNSLSMQWSRVLCGIDSLKQLIKLMVPVVPWLAISGIRFSNLNMK
jgi:hypothetical protein